MRKTTEGSSRSIPCAKLRKSLKKRIKEGYKVGRKELIEKCGRTTVTYKSVDGSSGSSGSRKTKKTDLPG